MQERATERRRSETAASSAQTSRRRCTRVSSPPAPSEGGRTSASRSGAPLPESISRAVRVDRAPRRDVPRRPVLESRQARTRCARARSVPRRLFPRCALPAMRSGAASDTGRIVVWRCRSVRSSHSLLSHLPDRAVQTLPVLVHAPQLLTPPPRQPVILPRRTFRRLLNVRLHVGFVFQPAEDGIDRPFSDDQAVDIAEAADDLVSIEGAVADGVQDRQFEEALAELRRPVLVEISHEDTVVPRKVSVNTR